MSKPNIVIRAFAVSVVLLFLVSGFTVMAYGSINSGHIASDDYTGHLLETHSTNAQAASTTMMSMTSYSPLNNPVQANAQITVTSAASGLQINSISYGDGVFLIGGENTSSFPLLLLLNGSSGGLRVISGILPSEFRAVTTISYMNNSFYIAGIPSGNEIPVAVLDLRDMGVSSLSSSFPSFATGPYVYASLIVGNELYLGGYYQASPKSAFLFAYNVTDGSVKNLTYLLPAQSSMVLTLSSNGEDLFIAGIYGNYSSFAIIYNASNNSSLNVDLPGQIESLSSSTYYNGSFYAGGSSTIGGAFLKIGLDGGVENLSQSFVADDIEVNTINAFNGNLFVGGWAINGSFNSIFNPSSSKIVKNVYAPNGWSVDGSEVLASCSNGSDILVGGSVVTQFYNYSGGLLGLINSNYSFTDISNLIPKTYKSVTYSAPPLQQFYIYAAPNIVFDNESTTFIGRGLRGNATYHLHYSNEALIIHTDAEGSFSYSVNIGNLAPGDYLITLTGQNNTYYNYFAVPYSYGKMIYGSEIPKTDTVGYSNLRYGAVVRDGEYLEFYRQVYGEIPITSINYLVQWNQILFQNLTSKGWTVAPVNQLGYASQFSINPATFQYSFWNDYGISEVSTSGIFTSFPKSNSYIYVNGSEMIVWIPYSIVNETYFPWVYATDYVQESPVYNPNYRIEAGQDFVSWYYGNETPSIINAPQPTIGQTPSTPNENYTNFSILTSYWLKLSKISANSKITIYMGFASNKTNLFNGVTVGEAPQLSSKYGEYDNGKNVFLYYTNFTSLNGWVVNVPKGSYSVDDGLSVGFNGPGYVVTDSTYGPGTAFMAGINSIGDVDDVGYFNIAEPVNNGGGWAGAFIRLACGNTYPDQWNASGEANGCGSPYGYFINKEGVPGTYLVEILNKTSSIQFLNGKFSGAIETDYPQYPAHVGFDGVYSPISVQWAAVLNMPPNGVMPSFNVSNHVYSAGSDPNVKVPSGIIYYVPIQITNDQPVPTPNEYQQLILVNSSEYLKYEAPNLDNVEFFYANGTVIPSWLESNNERTSGSIIDLIIKVTPAYLSSVIVNGQYMQVNSSGYLELNDVKPGTYSILAENPYYRWYFSNYTVTAGTYHINIDLMPAYKYHGEGEQYPWIQVGPAFFPNPFNSQNTIYLNASGHIGLIQIDPNNPDIIYIASGTAEDGIMGPIGDGGVYETYNDGGNWLPRDFGLPYGPICGFYMDPNNPNVLLVSFTNNGIYRTDDGGLWWYKVSNITGANNFKLSGQKIFAGSNVGVIESDDDGLTWSIVYNSQYPVGPISISGSDIYALVWGPGAPGIGESYIYMIKSNDLGATWETLHTFIGNYPVFISASPFNSSVVYLSYAGDKYTLFSEDGGITITNSSLVPVKDVVFDPKNESVLWAYGPAEFFYSFNGGKSFNEGMPATDNMGLAVYSGNGSMIVLGSDQGVYQSNDFGLNWKPISGDLSDTLTYSVSVGGNGSVIAVGMQDYSAFISIDDGKSWFGGNTQPIPIGGEGTDIAVNPANASWLYAYGWSGGLSVSDDGGLEFQSVVPGTPSYLLSPNALFIDPYNNSNVFFGYVQGVYNGTKYGKMWDLWTNSPADVTTVTMTGQNMFLVGTTNGAYYNLNGTWLRSSGISGYVTSFAVDPANKSVVVAATGMFSPGSLYISDDYGKSFSVLNGSFSNSEGGLFGIPIEVYWLNITGYPLIAATVNSGILISLDQGRSWVPINYNLRSGEVTSVSFNNGNLYISTYGEGVLVYPNFSIDSLPGTINGYTNFNDLNITINGQPINIYEGHFRVFLKPGNYTLSYLLNGVAKTIVIDVKPMGIYNIFINATPYRNYTIRFTETGLPTGTQWSVTLNGTTKSSTTNTITFSEPNGTYSYRIATVIKSYVPVPSSGTFTVNGESVNVSIIFKFQTFRGKLCYRALYIL